MPDARPHLHFTPRSGWMNDPHGLTHHRGRYHLFFQHAAGRTTWGPEQSWGHATSDDLLHWTEHDVVLAPGDGDHGVWSGSIAVPGRGPAALFYTSAEEGEPQIGRVRLARPEDDSWTRWRKGPVVAGLPPGVEATALRDPFVLHDGRGWRMILGAGLSGGSGAALTYVSDDLERWTYDGVLATRHRSATDPWTGAMWECPQLLRVADRWVLVVSAWSAEGPDNEAYAIGDLVDGRFVAETWGRLSHGPSSYAASAFVDADGDPCLIHWMRGVADPAGRWVGAHSLPQRLELTGGRLVVLPHPAVAAARTGSTTIREASDERTDPCDVEWTLDDPVAAASLTIAGADGPQARLDAADGNLTIRVGDDSWEMPIGGPEIRLILDGPTLEVFTSGGTFGAPVEGSVGRTIAAAGAGTARAHALS
jgi:beta-fructofuranosidase